MSIERKMDFYFGGLLVFIAINMFVVGCGTPPEENGKVPLNRVSFKLEISPENHSGWVAFRNFKVNPEGVLFVKNDAILNIDLQEKSLLVEKTEEGLNVYVPNEYDMRWGQVEENQELTEYTKVTGYHEVKASQNGIDQARREGIIDQLVNF